MWHKTANPLQHQGKCFNNNKLENCLTNKNLGIWLNDQRKGFYPGNRAYAFLADYSIKQQPNEETKQMKNKEKSSSKNIKGIMYYYSLFLWQARIGMFDWLFRCFRNHFTLDKYQLQFGENLFISFQVFATGWFLIN